MIFKNDPCCPQILNSFLSIPLPRGAFSDVIVASIITNGGVDLDLDLDLCLNANGSLMTSTGIFGNTNLHQEVDDKRESKKEQLRYILTALEHTEHRSIAIPKYADWYSSTNDEEIRACIIESYARYSRRECENALTESEYYRFAHEISIILKVLISGRIPQIATYDNCIAETKRFIVFEPGWYFPRRNLCYIRRTRELGFAKKIAKFQLECTVPKKDHGAEENLSCTFKKEKREKSRQQSTKEAEFIEFYKTFALSNETFATSVSTKGLTDAVTDCEVAVSRDLLTVVKFVHKLCANNSKLFRTDDQGSASRSQDDIVRLPELCALQRLASIYSVIASRYVEKRASCNYSPLSRFLGIEQCKTISPRLFAALLDIAVCRKLSREECNACVKLTSLGSRSHLLLYLSFLEKLLDSEMNTRQGSFSNEGLEFDEFNLIAKLVKLFEADVAKESTNDQREMVARSLRTVTDSKNAEERDSDEKQFIPNASSKKVSIVAENDNEGSTKNCSNCSLLEKTTIPSTSDFELLADAEKRLFSTLGEETLTKEDFVREMYQRRILRVIFLLVQKDIVYQNQLKETPFLRYAFAKLSDPYLSNELLNILSVLLSNHNLGLENRIVGDLILSLQSSNSDSGFDESSLKAKTRVLSLLAQSFLENEWASKSFRECGGFTWLFTMFNVCGEMKENGCLDKQSHASETNQRVSPQKERVTADSFNSLFVEFIRSLLMVFGVAAKTTKENQCYLKASFGYKSIATSMMKCNLFSNSLLISELLSLAVQGNQAKCCPKHKKYFEKSPFFYPPLYGEPAAHKSDANDSSRVKRVSNNEKLCAKLFSNEVFSRKNTDSLFTLRALPDEHQAALQNCPECNANMTVVIPEIIKIILTELFRDAVSQHLSRDTVACMHKVLKRVAETLIVHPKNARKLAAVDFVGAVLGTLKDFLLEHLQREAICLEILTLCVRVSACSTSASDAKRLLRFIVSSIESDIKSACAQKKGESVYTSSALLLLAANTIAKRRLYAPLSSSPVSKTLDDQSHKAWNNIEFSSSSYASLNAVFSDQENSFYTLATFKTLTQGTVVQKMPRSSAVQRCPGRSHYSSNTLMFTVDSQTIQQLLEVACACFGTSASQSSFFDLFQKKSFKPPPPPTAAESIQRNTVSTPTLNGTISLWLRIHETREQSQNSSEIFTPLFTSLSHPIVSRKSVAIVTQTVALSHKTKRLHLILTKYKAVQCSKVLVPFITSQAIYTLCDTPLPLREEMNITITFQSLETESETRCVKVLVYINGTVAEDSLFNLFQVDKKYFQQVQVNLKQAAQRYEHLFRNKFIIGGSSFVSLHHSPEINSQSFIATEQFTGYPLNSNAKSFKAVTSANSAVTENTLFDDATKRCSGRSKSNEEKELFEQHREIEWSFSGGFVIKKALSVKEMVSILFFGPDNTAKLILEALTETVDSDSGRVVNAAKSASTASVSSSEDRKSPISAAMKSFFFTASSVTSPEFFLRKGSRITQELRKRRLTDDQQESILREFFKQEKQKLDTVVQLVQTKVSITDETDLSEFSQYALHGLKSNLSEISSKDDFLSTFSQFYDLCQNSASTLSTGKSPHVIKQRTSFNDICGALKTVGENAVSLFYLPSFCFLEKESFSPVGLVPSSFFSSRVTPIQSAPRRVQSIPSAGISVRDDMTCASVIQEKYYLTDYASSYQVSDASQTPVAPGVNASLCSSKPFIHSLLRLGGRDTILFLFALSYDGLVSFLSFFPVLGTLLPYLPNGGCSLIRQVVLHHLQKRLNRKDTVLYQEVVTLQACFSLCGLQLLIKKKESRDITPQQENDSRFVVDVSGTITNPKAFRDILLDWTLWKCCSQTTQHVLFTALYQLFASSLPSFQEQEDDTLVRYVSASVERMSLRQSYNIMVAQSLGYIDVFSCYFFDDTIATPILLLVLRLMNALVLEVPQISSLAHLYKGDKLAKVMIHNLDLARTNVSQVAQYCGQSEKAPSPRVTKKKMVLLEWMHEIYSRLVQNYKCVASSSPDDDETLAKIAAACEKIFPLADVLALIIFSQECSVQVLLLNTLALCLEIESNLAAFIEMGGFDVLESALSRSGDCSEELITALMDLLFRTSPVVEADANLSHPFFGNETCLCHPSVVGLLFSVLAGKMFSTAQRRKTIKTLGFFLSQCSGKDRRLLLDNSIIYHIAKLLQVDPSQELYDDVFSVTKLFVQDFTTTEGGKELMEMVTSDIDKSSEYSNHAVLLSGRRKRRIAAKLKMDLLQAHLDFFRENPSFVQHHSLVSASDVIMRLSEKSICELIKNALFPFQQNRLGGIATSTSSVPPFSSPLASPLACSPTFSPPLSTDPLSFKASSSATPESLHQSARSSNSGTLPRRILAPLPSREGGFLVTEQATPAQHDLVEFNTLACKLLLSLAQVAFKTRETLALHKIVRKGKEDITKLLTKFEQHVIFAASMLSYAANFDDADELFSLRDILSFVSRDSAASDLFGSSDLIKDQSSFPAALAEMVSSMLTASCNVFDSPFDKSWLAAKISSHIISAPSLLLSLMSPSKKGHPEMSIGEKQLDDGRAPLGMIIVFKSEKAFIKDHRAQLSAARKHHRTKSGISSNGGELSENLSVTSVASSSATAAGEPSTDFNGLALPEQVSLDVNDPQLHKFSAQMLADVDSTTMFYAAILVLSRRYVESSQLVANLWIGAMQSPLLKDVIYHAYGLFAVAVSASDSREWHGKSCKGNDLGIKDELEIDAENAKLIDAPDDADGPSPDESDVVSSVVSSSNGDGASGTSCAPYIPDKYVCRASCTLCNGVDEIVTDAHLLHTVCNPEQYKKVPLSELPTSTSVAEASRDSHAQRQYRLKVFQVERLSCEQTSAKAVMIIEKLVPSLSFGETSEAERERQRWNKKAEQRQLVGNTKTDLFNELLHLKAEHERSYILYLQTAKSVSREVRHGWKEVLNATIRSPFYPLLENFFTLPLVRLQLDPTEGPARKRIRLSLTRISPSVKIKRHASSTLLCSLPEPAKQFGISVEKPKDKKKEELLSVASVYDITVMRFRYDSATSTNDDKFPRIVAVEPCNSEDGRAGMQQRQLVCSEDVSDKIAAKTGLLFIGSEPVRVLSIEGKIVRIETPPQQMYGTFEVVLIIGNVYSNYRIAHYKYMDVKGYSLYSAMYSKVKRFMAFAPVHTEEKDAAYLSQLIDFGKKKRSAKCYEDGAEELAKGGIACRSSRTGLSGSDDRDGLPKSFGACSSNAHMLEHLGDEHETSSGGVDSVGGSSALKQFRRQQSSKQSGEADEEENDRAQLLLGDHPITVVYCSRITLFDETIGELLVGEKSIAFRGREGTHDKNCSYCDINQVMKRRYLLRDYAFELFLFNGKTLLFAFYSQSIRNEILELIVKKIPRYFLEESILNSPTLAPLSGGSTPQGKKVSDEAFSEFKDKALSHRFHFMNSLSFLNLKTVTRLWTDGQISNYQYLMELNTRAGRTFNDLNQYPVFPHIIGDYRSPCPDKLRKLDLPIGAQDDERFKGCLETYNSLKEIGEFPYLYGSHYSSAAVVNYYLIRLEPFATFHREFQSGRFDFPDRLFGSFSQAYTGDSKELTPEAFSLAAMFQNVNHFDFGVKQNGAVVDDVVLPPWAKTARDFVYRHYLLLESDAVSQMLHLWIDLIFGVKQQSLEAKNVFHPYSTENGVDLAQLETQEDKLSAITQILTFGQIPKQLFASAHPRRKPNARAIVHSFVSENVFSLAYRKLWMVGKAIGTLCYTEHPVVSEPSQCFLYPSGECFARFGTWDNSVEFQTVSGKCITRLAFDSDDRIIKVCHSQNATVFVAAAVSGRLYIVRRTDWPFFTFPPPLTAPPRVTTAQPHRSRILSLSVCGDQRAIVTGGADGVCAITDTFTGRKIAAMAHASPVVLAEMSVISGDICTICYAKDTTGFQCSCLTLWSIAGELLYETIIFDRLFSFFLFISFCYVMLCYVMYCIVLYCIVLYCIVLYCIVLYCSDLFMHLF